MPKIAPVALLAGALAGLLTGEKMQDSQPIRDEQYAQLNAWLTARLEQAPKNRAAYWKLDFSSKANYERSLQRYRNDWAAMLGVPPAYTGPLNQKRVKIGEDAKVTMYRVWFDALPGVQTYGILLLPKNGSGRAPALICQHGHADTPEKTMGLVDGPIYRNFARVFAEKGFVTFSPYLISLYSEESQPAEGPRAWGRDILFKKGMMVGHTLVGIEARKFTRTVDYLQSLPEVDPERIGMYGLSKGGQYTLAIAPIETRLKVAVVSGWFNDRAKKNLEQATDPSMHFITKIHRSEYYMLNLLDRFGDAELAWMIAPRPLLIENGDRDGAVHIDDARAEFQRVRAVYEKLGVPDRAVFAGFHGEHRIDGAESFPFVEKWLAK
jgi:cephalosporin-C deacetylase-like acetyl esterase